MKTVAALVLVLSVCVSLGCNKQGTYMKPFPYNPEKAGATIVKSFNITRIIPFETNPLRRRVFMNFDMAEYNGNIYVRFRNILFIFDKKTMRNTRKININMPPEYRYLPIDNSEFYDIRSNGLVITDEHAFILLGVAHIHPTFYSNSPYLFSVDLHSGNAELLDKQTLGFKFDNRSTNIMGYSKADNKIWFRVNNWDKRRVFLYAFIYDNNSKMFTLTDTSDWDIMEVNPIINRQWGELLSSSFSGNEVWSTYLLTPSGERFIAIIDRRYMNDLTKIVSQIHVEHLGTLTVPKSIIYDEPYIWIIAEKKGKIQMLKLLPKE